MSRANDLRKLASMLPQIVKTDRNGVQVKINRRVSGQSLINRGMNTVKGPDGKKILVNPKKFYNTQVPDYVDHYSELKKIYRQHGDKGVSLYVSGLQKLPTEKRLKKENTEERRQPVTVRKRKITFKEKVQTKIKSLFK